jgi:hypothetical protein
MFVLDFLGWIRKTAMRNGEIMVRWRQMTALKLPSR